jgi:uncharacterized protein (DUF885 family)
MRGWIVGALFVLAAHAAAAEARLPAGAEAKARLARAADEFWRREQDENLDVARIVGRPPRHLPIVSAGRCAADARTARRRLAELGRIDPAALDAGDRVTFEMLRWDAGQRIERARFCWLQPLLTPYSTPLNSAQSLLAGHPLDRRADLESYRRRLGEMARFVAAIEAFTRGQAARGIVLPRDELPAVLALLDAYAAEPDRSPLRVADARLARVDADDARAFQAEVARLIRTRVNPRVRALRDYVAGAYRAQAPAAAGLYQYPQGEAYYRHLVRFHTTLDLTPEAVHARGVDAVAEIEAQMREVRRQAGFAGSEAEFRALLRTDPRLRAATPADVEARLARPVAEVSAVIGRYFPRLPKAPYGLRRLDASLEGAQAFGYYDPPSAHDPKGYYNYNASHLDQRSMLQARAIALHELLPGHHLQLSLQMENASIPEFRRLGLPTAFVEGWGTYASWLGVEMGVYADPYDRYGQLALDLFMAVRLVVDTGMNHYRWPRERAAAYMREHLTLSDAEIGAETLRYAADMPGQALAYRIGYEALLRLRRDAERRAGAAFDLAAFHGCVLGQGAMPLVVLERHLRSCLAGDDARPARTAP